MNVNDFRKAILDSDFEDWIYHPDLRSWVLKSDLLISICEEDIGEMQLFNEPWATAYFMDKKAYKTRFFLKYGTNVVRIVYAAVVDGARVTIPFPKVNTNNLSGFDDKIGTIINCQTVQEYRNSLNLARLIVEE